MRANVICSRSFIRLAVFELQSEWTVGVGGGEGETLHFPTLSSLLFFNRRPPPIQISFSPQPSSASKIRDGGHNFVKKLLGTRSPNSRLVCRLDGIIFAKATYYTLFVFLRNNVATFFANAQLHLVQILNPYLLT